MCIRDRGIPPAWRQVLYCMEAIKLIATCEICTGADRGTKPSASETSISMAMSSVSQRMGRRRLTGLGASADKNAPMR